MSKGDVWTERGFEDFVDGTFGNAGQNLYVSRAGILQRINHFDVNSDGYVDVLFNNTHDDNCRMPAYVYVDPLGEAVRRELPTDGAYAGAVGDLNGDGIDDFVIAMQFNGIHNDLRAYIYYGSERGLSERYKFELPSPSTTDVAIGDFNGDGRPDLAFVSEGKLRVFYQTELGFDPADPKDLDISVTNVASADLDGDGYDDLFVRGEDPPLQILWGGPGGLDPENSSAVGMADAQLVGGKVETVEASSAGVGAAISDAASLGAPKTVRLGGEPHLFVPHDAQAEFIPVRLRASMYQPI